MSTTTLFSDEDKEQIRRAVEEAEKRTSGEIVPVIVQSSARYDIALWKGAMIGVLPGLVASELLFTSGESWGSVSAFSPLSAPILMIVGALVVALAVRGIPALKRWLIPENSLVTAVHGRAQKAFLENEVFQTRERTGILLLVSLFERRVEVLGDSGINSKVSPEEWADVVTDIVLGIKSGKPTTGIVSAIERCGSLLENAGVAIRSDDENELDDGPRIEE